MTDYFEEMRNIKAIQGINQYVEWIHHNFGINAWILLDTGQVTNVKKMSSDFLDMVAHKFKSFPVLALLWKPENEGVTNLLSSGGSIEILHVLDALKLDLPFMYSKYLVANLKYLITHLEFLQPLVNSSIIGSPILLAFNQILLRIFCSLLAK